jgi:hypothetical protein
MPMRYYFDLRDGDGFVADEEGMDLPTLAAAHQEAALSLAGMARDAGHKTHHGPGYEMAVSVRDENGPLLQAKFTVEVNHQSLNRWPA